MAFAVVALADVPLLARRGVSARAVLASSAVSCALGFVVSALCAAPAAGLEMACAAIARSRTGWRRLSILPVALAAIATGAVVTLAPFRHEGWTRPALVGFAGSVVACALLSRWRRRGWAQAAALCILAGALAPDVWFDPLNSDLHDLLGIVEVCAVLAMLTGPRSAIATRKGWALGAVIAGLGLLAVVAVLAAHALAPGWRLPADRYGRVEPRLERACRVAFDFDGDGFSSLFWGGDCDDRDPLRNPRALERETGVDANCNGTVLPAHAVDADMGLEPPAGDPNLERGAVDLFLLLTIDCLRADAVDGPWTPHLAQLARGGIRMSRMYAAATNTATSMYLAQRTRGPAPTLARRLALVGVESTALLSIGAQMDILAEGYGRRITPGLGQRWSASEVTARALEAIRDPGPRFVWAHYIDLHQPIGSPRWIETGKELTVARVPPEYYRALTNVDDAIGQLIDELERDGRMARTVVVVTADHGESFGAHGVDYHALDAYEELVHVPAVLVGPGLVAGTYRDLVSLRDLPPTVLGAFGAADASAEAFGRSWMRMRAAPSAPLHRFVVTYSSARRIGSVRMLAMAGVIERRLKLTDTFENNLTEMFDLDADPGENEDLAPLRAAEAARLKGELALFRDLDGFE